MSVRLSISNFEIMVANSVRRALRSGASVAVQGLADPLIAAAHAGLSFLTVVAVTDCGAEPLRMADLVERAEACAPALEELVLHLGPDLAELAGDADAAPDAEELP